MFSSCTLVIGAVFNTIWGFFTCNRLKTASLLCLASLLSSCGEAPPGEAQVAPVTSAISGTVFRDTNPSDNLGYTENRDIPLAGMTVSAVCVDENGLQYNSSALSASDGRYSLDVVDKGRCRISIDGFQIDSHLISFNSVGGSELANTVIHNVKPAEDSRVIDFGFQRDSQNVGCSACQLAEGDHFWGICKGNGQNVSLACENSCCEFSSLETALAAVCNDADSNDDRGLVNISTSVPNSACL